MTNANTIELKIEDTLENLKWNIEYLANKADRHAQCTLSVRTLIGFKVDINGYEDLLCEMENQADEIMHITTFINSQQDRIYSLLMLNNQSS